MARTRRDHRREFNPSMGLNDTRGESNDASAVGRSLYWWIIIKLDFRPYIRRYTSPNENFEYSYSLIFNWEWGGRGYD